MTHQEKCELRKQKLRAKYGNTSEVLFNKETMTPKQKAEELVYKFYPNVQWKLGQEDCLDRALRCALIAVDEMIKETRTKYWYDVKKEIELL